MLAVTTCLPARSAVSTNSFATPPVAADQLDEGVDLRITGKLDRIGDEAKAGDVGVAVLVPVERRDCDDLDGPADALGEG